MLSYLGTARPFTTTAWRKVPIDDDAELSEYGPAIFTTKPWKKVGAIDLSQSEPRAERTG